MIQPTFVIFGCADALTQAMSDPVVKKFTSLRNLEVFRIG
jgi:hypothetical protein